MIINDYLGAFFIGFLGSAHCIGMCGGIAAAMSIRSVASTRRLSTTLFYNLGRLISYAIAGAVVGGAVAGAATLVSGYAVLNWLRLLSGMVMIVLALYIAKWWQGLLYVEKMGQHLWKHISPFTKKLLPLPSAAHALPLGFLWGWLPCGLVYSTLTWAAVAGSAVDGSAIMLAFGLGTLPSMLLIGAGAGFISRLQKSLFFRHCGALLLLAYGAYITTQTLSIILVK